MINNSLQDKIENDIYNYIISFNEKVIIKSIQDIKLCKKKINLTRLYQNLPNLKYDILLENYPIAKENIIKQENDIRILFSSIIEYFENVHVTDIQKGFVKAGKDKAQIIQIRDFEHCQDVFISTVSCLIECYNEYLTKRIPEKRNELTGTKSLKNHMIKLF
ncbi:hypothetical protein [Psychroflexus gondwanensis]|jgi:hypothetical protein|uniref:hypothetical protein n=1 Tax=Psychroflexus gondwanensis TaxID=251 RepID=UPI00039BBB03|nr:hypothetical protein [Psychroflexus gondwanensis]